MNYMNNARKNLKLKIRKKDYIQERKIDNMYLEEDLNGIKYGGHYDIGEKLWRGKTRSFIGKTNQEKNFYIKEVMKKYQTNQDELKGYNYKYILELADLLGQKDKDFSKKRLQLYNHRIEREKKQYSKTHEKFIKYQTYYKPKKQTNIFMDFFNSQKTKPIHRGNNVTSLSNTLHSNKDNKEANMHYKTSYNINSPYKLGKFDYLLNNKISKKYNENKYNNILTEITYKKSEQDEQSFDTTSLVGKEDFLASGDKERYHEYLSREYNFFNQARLRQMRYIFDKQKRIKLFKKLPNAKFLNYKKDNPLRTELFNKIKREKERLAKELQKSEEKKIHFSNKKGTQANKRKDKFNQECLNILDKIKKNFS